MQRVTYRNIQNSLLFFTILALVLAFYAEYITKIQPCPLCMMQRFCAFIFGFFCLVGLSLRTLHRTRILTFVQIVIAGLGLYFSLRQISLQSIPIAQPQAASCMPGVDALIHYFSYGAIIKAFLWGSTQCTKISSKWLGLSMPVWSTIYFSLMTLSNIILAVLLTITLKKTTETNAPQ